MRDDELGARVFETAHQFDGVFDAFARDDARGLQNEKSSSRRPISRRRSRVIIVDAGRRRFEVDDVRE